MLSDNTIGLYIHIPFCKSKCLYCNFYSIAGDYSIELQEEYLDYIIKELNLRLPQIKNKIIDTIYIGGGTPSYIHYELYEKFFNSLFSIVIEQNIKEFTIELNPSDINNNLIALLKKINNIRLSIGIESMDNSILKTIGRNITNDIIFNALDIVDSYNIENVSLDFISSLPLSSINSSKDSIELLLKKYKNINHISFYYLELDDRKQLKNKWQNILPSEDDEIEEYKIATKLLEDYGFERYEISSFAKSIDFYSKHNIHYWSLDDYLALGAGAYGCIDNMRYNNTMNMDKYFKLIKNGDVPTENIEKLGIEEREKEFIFLSLRQKNGINISKYNQLFNTNFIDKYTHILNKNINSFDVTKENISIKKSLINFSDEISLLFF